MDKVERSILSEGASTMKVIPHGIDLKEFKPVPKSNARAQLGLPPGCGRDAVCGEWHPPEHLEGLRHHARAVEMVSSRMTGGTSSSSRLRRRSERSHRQCGDQVHSVSEDPVAVARFYSAADLPSRHARRHVSERVLEALACGTPSSGRLSAAFPSRSRESAARRPNPSAQHAWHRHRDRDAGACRRT
jgi:hypothetical protein